MKRKEEIFKVDLEQFKSPYTCEETRPTPYIEIKTGIENPHLTLNNRNRCWDQKPFAVGLLLNARASLDRRNQFYNSVK